MLFLGWEWERKVGTVLMGAGMALVTKHRVQIWTYLILSLHILPSEIQRMYSHAREKTSSMFFLFFFLKHALETLSQTPALQSKDRMELLAGTKLISLLFAQLFQLIHTIPQKENCYCTLFV